VRRAANIDAGPLLSVVGGVVLLVSLFLHWYQPGISAWTAFEIIDLLLALSAVAAVLTALRLLQIDLFPFLPIRREEPYLVTAGIVAFVLVCSQLLNHPPAAQHEGVMFGAWLGLGGSALMLAGGIATIVWVSLRVTVDRRPQPPAPPRAPAEPGRTEETREIP
jgi:hypothetical protein